VAGSNTSILPILLSIIVCQLVAGKTLLHHVTGEGWHQVLANTHRRILFGVKFQALYMQFGFNCFY